MKSSLLAPAAVAAAQGTGSAGAATGPFDEPIGPLSLDHSLASPTPGAGRERLLLDFGWRFHFGNAADASKDFDYSTPIAGNFQKTGNFMPAAAATFDDTDWRALNLPHDWAIELPFTNDPELKSKGYYPLGRKYPATSVGWYRRIFELSEDDAGKRITIEFDGAYRDALVVFNGFYIGKHSGGYDPFSFDLTDFAYPGLRNTLLVRVDATETDGWFYEGAGIYRHVWLVKTNPIHVKKWGTFVRSDVNGSSAKLSIHTEVANHGKAAANARVVSTILDPAGNTVGKNVSASAAMEAGNGHDYEQQIAVSNAKLWSLEERNLYKLVTEIQSGGKVVDRYETPFGIRTVKFDAQRGFFLNGKPVKLKGTCNHQDHAGLGVALPDAVQYYRIRKLQEMGCNSIRTSHNPPTPELLDACDQLGMLVFDETRMMSSNPEGLAQFSNLVRRDRNRPSVFMWSMGNEEGQANTPKGVLILTSMKDLANKLDGSRPVSIAPTGAIGTGGLAVCDVDGYNYMDPQAAAFHKEHPDRPVMGTETVSAVGTRGIYITDHDKGYVAAYDPYTTTGRASAEGWWRFCDAQPWLSGGFVWTGFDYRGEPSPDDWHNISSQYGIIDTCGFPKDSFFYYQSWWTDTPVLHLFPHWNWKGMEGKTISVWVYSNLDKVELLHNGQSLGEKAVPKNSHVDWVVKYAPGEIEARGFKNGKQVMTAKRATTGEPAKLVLSSDRKAVNADGEDVAMFAVEVQDGQGRTVPIADNEVTFKVSGAGKLIGVGNGDPTDLDSDIGTRRKAFCGYCMGIVQSGKQAGNITVEVSAGGLSSATLTIPAKQAELRPQLAEWVRPIPKGPGITGLWRPVPDADIEDNRLLQRILGSNAIFSLHQQGGALTGDVEGSGGFFGGGEVTPIKDGKIEGSKVSFSSGINSYTGEIKGDRIELDRTFHIPWHFNPPSEPAPNAPDIGPAPDGTDPSRDPTMKFPTSFKVVLQRADR
ncbi:MAG TPA: beta-galactosidase GalA [Terracidiphilus sp.]|nr:beta-galactosidase GalA [Terracidiphilus sp.]